MLKLNNCGPRHLELCLPHFLLFLETL